MCGSMSDVRGAFWFVGFRRGVEESRFLPFDFAQGLNDKALWELLRSLPEGS